MAAFPSPAAGYEDRCVWEELGDFLVPKPAATMLWLVREDFHKANLSRGDLLVVEMDRVASSGCLALVDYQGARFVCQMFYKNGAWYAITDSRAGRVADEEFTCVGVITRFIKNQLNDNTEVL